MTCTAETHQTDHPGRVIITNLLTTKHHLLPPAHTCSTGLEIKERNTVHAIVKDASEIADHRNRSSMTADQYHLRTNTLPSVPSSPLPRLHSACSL